MPTTAPDLRPLRPAALASAGLSGILLALAFPGFLTGAVAWLALVPLLLVAFVPRRKRDMLALFGAFGTGFYLTLLYWFLAMHPLTWLGFSEAQSIAIVVTAWLGSTFLLVLQLLGLGYLYGWIAQRWAEPGWKHVVSLALGWVTLEWLTSLGAFGFTWGNMALTQYQALPMIQVLGLVGPFPLAALIVGVNGAIAVGLHRSRARGVSLAAWKPLGVALVPVAAALGYGAYRLAQPQPEAGAFSVQLVQGNMAGSEKWAKDPNAIHRMADKYLGLTGRHPDAQLVVWPETAMPAFLRNDPGLYGRLRQAADDQNRYLMFGTLDWSDAPPGGRKLFNAVTVLGPAGETLGFDYKRHLVPFGEYVPYRDKLPQALMATFGLVNAVGADYSPGVDPYLFRLPFATVGAGVCFDGIFPDAIRPAVAQGAEVVALVTNDAWYKDTSAPRILNAHAVLRAVENDRYVLRAANTGISSIIAPTGNIVAATGVYQDATLVGRAAPVRRLTPYTRFGDWAPMLAGAGFVGFGIRRWTRRKRKDA